MSKIVTVKTTCTGTIRETWRFRVSDDWQADPDEDENALEALLRNEAERLDVTDETTDEHDREVTSVTVEPEPPADEPEFEQAICGCGYPIIRTPEGWQHDAAPYFWGDDHDAEPY